MEITELQNRIAKKEAEIEKAQRLFDKYTANFDDEDKDLIKGSASSYRNYSNIVVPFLDNKYGFRNWGYSVKGRDAESARSNLSKLEDAQLTLDKYKNLLNAEQAKQAQLDAPRIKVIMDFLADWKQKVTKATVENAKLIVEYNKVDHEDTDWFNNRWHLTDPENPDHISKEEWEFKYKSFRARLRTIKASINPLTSEVYSRATGDHIDHEKLDKILSQEADAMYLDMVNRVTAITGEITDASNLSIGEKGELNGIIIGVKGKAKIQTIGAGGENAGIIVNTRRGPVFHFRTLIHEVK